MNNARRLSKLDIAISFIRNIRNFIPLIILSYIRIKEAAERYLLWVLLVGGLLLLINGLMSFLVWRKFQYSLEQDRLIIRRGVITREEKTIYYSRIHSVNVQQPLLLRIFGAASLQIETPGGKPGKPEAELRVLQHAQALELQRQLKHLRSVSSGERAKGSHEQQKSGVADQLQQQNDPVQFAGAPLAERDAENQETLHSDSQRYDAERHAGQRHEESQPYKGQLKENQQYGAQQYEDQNYDEKRHEGYKYGESPELQQDAGLNIEDQRDEPLDYLYRLSFGQLLKASLTSLNLNFALLFIFGVYSFADDVLDIIFPGMYDRLLNGMFEQYSALPIFLILLLTIIVLGFVWLLSIAIYLIKFGDYQISRSHEQLSVSYGLLEKKSFIFDQNKVQAVIMDENPLRQWLGFAELRVQVITSNAMEQLVIHPFARKKDIPAIMEQLLPDRTIQLRKVLHAPPAAAFRTYAMLPAILTLLIVAGAVWWWKWTGLWLLLLLPVILSWSFIRMRSAGVWLEGNDLVLRKRSINRVTYFVRRKHIVTLKLGTSPIQRKRKLHNIRVQVLGSAFAYKVKSIADEHVLPIWKWYSRGNKG